MKASCGEDGSGRSVGDTGVWFAADREAAIEVSQTSHDLCTTTTYKSPHPRYCILTCL